MRILIIDGYPPVHPDRGVVRVSADVLSGRGHDVEVFAVHEGERSRSMTEAERRAYHEQDNQISAEIREAAELLHAVDGLLFCYPSMSFTVPAATKAWIEKSFLPGVGFVFNDKGKLRPGLRNIRRLGIVTTTPHGRFRRARARDGGCRMIMRGLRIQCHPRCRHGVRYLPPGLDEVEATARIDRTLRRW